MSESIFTRLARLLLLLTLMFGSMAFGAVQPWAWGSIAVAVALCLAMWAAAVAIGTQPVSWSWLYLPAALLLALALTQLFAGISANPAGTREAVVKLGAILTIFFLVTQLYRTAPRRAWGFLGYLFLLFTAAYALFAILQSLSGRGEIYWRVPSPNDNFGAYVDRDHYAGLMEMLIPVAAASLFLAGRKRIPLLPMFGVVLAMVSLLMTGSRGGLVALIAELVIGGGLLLISGVLRQRIVIGAAAGVLFIALGVLWLTLAPKETRARLEGVIHLTDTRVAAERPQLTRDALRIFREHPKAGTGLGTFEVVYPRYQSFTSTFLYDHAHDDFAEFLAETGAPGAVLAVAGLTLFLWLAFRGVRTRLDEPRGAIQTGAAVGCCGLLAHSLVDFNLHIPANAAWFAACVGLATLRPAEGPEAGESRTSADKRKRRRHHRSGGERHESRVVRDRHASLPLQDAVTASQERSPGAKDSDG